MEIPIYQIDAFTQQAFAGNPAAVCPLEYWLNDDLMQKIAAENNLSETVFFVKEQRDYRIRWFTPKCEIDLCGHATLAAAYVLWNFLGETGTLRFHSLSGQLTVTRDGGLLVLDFPARPIEDSLQDPSVHAALNGASAPVWIGHKDGRVLIEYETQADVAALAPNFNQLAALPYSSYFATAPGEKNTKAAADFVCRMFAPQKGVNEDPVTGSAYTTLTPYWTHKLQKQKLYARQISARGGEIYTECAGDRVAIAGHACCVLKGTFLIPQHL